jgi:S1-C subfamily serine protease
MTTIVSTFKAIRPNADTYRILYDRGSRYTMKKFFPALLFLTLTIFGCCVNTHAKHPIIKQTLVDELMSDTVAFVRKDSDGDFATWCAGVWVDDDKILTANHCARAPIDEIIKDLVEGEERREKLSEEIEDGFTVKYMINSESTGVWREPKKTHTARVVKHDKVHDLALLVIDPDDVPQHTTVTLAQQTPAVGEAIHVMGHVVGLAWTYTKCSVSAYREENFRPVMKQGKRGPYMQVAGEVFSGNSGGGAFNDSRELIGIASFMMPAPNESAFIHIETIKSFLSQ